MTRIVLMCVFLTTMLSSFSQSKVDTLVIGPRKYPLKKNEIFRVVQNGPIDLPSEYERFKNYEKKIRINFKFKSDTTNIVTLLEDGTEVQIKKHTSCNNTHTDDYIDLFSFTDTVKVTYKELHDLKPYIKTSNSKIYFNYSKISCLLNESLNEITHRNMTNGNIFAYWHSYPLPKDSEINNIKKTTFVLQDLYYLINNSTFYLDREFIIIVK